MRQVPLGLGDTTIWGGAIKDKGTTKVPNILHTPLVSAISMSRAILVKHSVIKSQGKSFKELAARKQVTTAVL